MHENEKLQEFFVLWTMCFRQESQCLEFRAVIPKVQTPVQIGTERLVNPDQTCTLDEESNGPV